MLKKLLKRQPVISKPTDVTQDVRIDKDLNWLFGSNVDPRSIFTKLNVIGRGGFGTVARIVHRPSMRVLAGKLINQNLLNEDTRKDVEHEIKLMKEVDSPYTVHYYGCVPYENTLMILMEYCDGGSLRDLLDKREQVLSEDQISIIMRDLLKGLQLIHTRYRIVHRDIKAANILLTMNGEVRIADFGVSRRFESSGTCHTKTIVGTPYWMAPEVITGNNYSYSADIWSMGITAIELAEGSPPYVEYSPTKAMVEIAVNGFPGYRFPELHSIEFCDFVSNCLKKNPDDRMSIEKFLEHPFIKRAERLSRDAVLASMIKSSNNIKRSSQIFDDDDEMLFGISEKDNEVQYDKGYLSSNLMSSSNMSSFESPSMPLIYESDFNTSNTSNQKNHENESGFYIESSSSEKDSRNSKGKKQLISLNFNSFESAASYLNESEAYLSNKAQKNKMNSSEQIEQGEEQYCSLASGTPFIDINSAGSFMSDSNFNSIPRLNSIVEKDSTSSNGQEFNNLNQKKKKTVVFNPLNIVPKNIQSNRTMKPKLISDQVFVKVSRIMSLKIPFIPLKYGTNQDADVKTLYKTRKEYIDINAMKKGPVFDSNGQINIHSALRKKNTSIYFSFFIIVFVLYLFGIEGFSVLVCSGFILNIIIFYLRKQREISKNKNTKNKN